MLIKEGEKQEGGMKKGYCLAVSSSPFLPPAFLQSSYTFISDSRRRILPAGMPNIILNRRQK